MKRLALALLSSTVGLMLMPASSPGANVVTYVGCSSTAEAPPSHVCRLGDEPGAFFESETEVEYEVCVTFPNAETLCAEEEIAEAETLYVNTITSNLPGEHLVTWYIEGLQVASWSFRLDAPPAPAPIALPPSSPTVVQPPTGQGPRCRNAKHRIAKLVARLRTAATHSERLRIQAQLKAARSHARSVCS
jgi:hypothetical protein